MHAVLTCEDLPDYRIGRAMRDMPLLARDKVRFIGEKVAAVAADDVEIAEAACALIDVEYEELPAVFDPLEAMQPDAPLVHDPDLVRAWKTPSQVVADYPNSVSMPRWGASRRGGRAALRAATTSSSTRSTRPSSTRATSSRTRHRRARRARHGAHLGIQQGAVPAARLSRDSIGLTREQMEFHMLPLGGDFGGKGSFMDIPLAYFLARAERPPGARSHDLRRGADRRQPAARVHHRRQERLRRTTATCRPATRVRTSTVAPMRRSSPRRTPRCRTSAMAVWGTYEAPVWRVEGHMIYTNTVPCGHMRAPGDAQPYHALECHMDLCARAMGIDPLEVRLRNATTDRRDDSRVARCAARPPRATEVLQDGRRGDRLG